MNRLPNSRNTPVIRTDYSDREAWDVVRAAILAPSDDGFRANVGFFDDPAYQDLTPGQVLALVPPDDEYLHPVIIVADKATITSASMPLLVLNLWEERGREIRIPAADLWGIENNLSIANMDFDDWADPAAEDGLLPALTSSWLM